jgi:DNA mismatch repair protein MutS
VSGEMARFISILFPESRDAAGLDSVTQPACFSDLHLDQVVAEVVGADNDQLAQFFYYPLHDSATVAYRHEVFGDLQRGPIRGCIENFATAMDTMRKRLDRARHLWHPLQQQGWFVYAVEAYCDAMTALRDELSQIDPPSHGLRALTGYVIDYVGSDRFQALVAETAGVQAELHRIRYAVHIEGPKVHVDTYEGQTDYSADVAATFERFASQIDRDYHVQMKDFADMNHVEEQVLECVAKLYPAEFDRLKRFCAQHRKYLDATISRFDREIQFYLSYLAFMDHLTEAGPRFSYPNITEDAGKMTVQDAFDLALAIKVVRDGDTVVRNSFHLCGAERVFVITGPNQGGKTTFARTIGQLVYLAALGCPVPAASATLILADDIYTHFERQETLATLRGKLDNELERIHDILSTATSDSIIVMNESFSSTTVDDSVLIGTEVLQRIIAIGCVAVYVTFLDELASLDPVCVSMVGEVAPHDPTQRTFRFTRRRADGMAYAAALAAKYGLTHESLLDRITR